MMKNIKTSGFTLIELMISVAIVAILAAIAYPSYAQYVLSSHRTEAITALTKIANLEERYYLDNNAYGSVYNLGLTSSTTATYNTENKYYTITINLIDSSDTTNSAYFKLTAAAINTQASDTDCSTLTLTSDGTKGSSSQNASTCWK
jgi:type IV pilus assembly protein PilE